MNAIRAAVGGVCLAGILFLCPGWEQIGAAQTPVARATLTAHAGNVAGAVKDGNDKPIPGSHLRLRDLTAGRIVATTRADQHGQFRFAGVAAGSYLVELLDERGNVRAVGQTFTLGTGETMSTFVRVGGESRWYHGFFTNAALTAVSSAATVGVTAVGHGGQPTSGRF